MGVVKSLNRLIGNWRGWRNFEEQQIFCSRDGAGRAWLSITATQHRVEFDKKTDKCSILLERGRLPTLPAKGSKGSALCPANPPARSKWGFYQQFGCVHQGVVRAGLGVGRRRVVAG